MLFATERHIHLLIRPLRHTFITPLLMITAIITDYADYSRYTLPHYAVDIDAATERLPARHYYTPPLLLLRRY